jgi:YidC/Oxa1 family membrane protein insertase
MLELWNGVLVYPLLNLLVAAYNVVRDYGVAIIAVTVGLRLILYPLFVAQMRSQRAMQDLAPAMNELKQKFAKDRQRLAQAQMELYRERGYNPAMGCLPLLVQLPILFAFFAALDQAPRLNGARLAEILWPFVQNPLQPDELLTMRTVVFPWLTDGLAQPDPLKIIPILAGATQFVASLMAQVPLQPGQGEDPQARMMRSMTYYFPILTVFFAWGLPAGLGVYWVATTVFQIVQQYFVSGWGDLPRFMPFLRGVPTPADRHARERAAAAAQTAALAAPASPGSRRTSADADRPASSGDGAPAPADRAQRHRPAEPAARRRGGRRRRR